MELTYPVTLVIMAITALVSVAAFGNVQLFGDLLFDPYLIRVRRQWYRFFSHAFVHANWSHLLVNMFVLYMFGRNVEPLLGMITGGASVVPYAVLYLGGVLFASLPSYRKHQDDPNYRAVGASGAVSAVLFAQILLLPTMGVRIMFIPVDMPAWVFGIIYLWYSWYMDKRGGDNVAHDAHFYGAVYGVLFIAVLEPSVVLHLGSFQRSLGL